METGLPCTGQGGPWKGGEVKAGPGHTLGLLWEGGTYVLCLPYTCGAFPPASVQPGPVPFSPWILSCIHSFMHLSIHHTSVCPPTYSCICSSVHLPAHSSSLPSPFPLLSPFFLFIHLPTCPSVYPVCPSHLNHPPFHRFTVIQSINTSGAPVRTSLWLKLRIHAWTRPQSLWWEDEFFKG